MKGDFPTRFPLISCPGRLYRLLGIILRFLALKGEFDLRDVAASRHICQHD